MKSLKIFLTSVALYLASSCSYLDVIPDNIATIEMAFNTRTNAERYLATCYHMMPEVLNPFYNAALTAGDDIWWYSRQNMWFDATRIWEMARGNQNTYQVLFNYWDEFGMFRGVRDCNIFLDNIDRVPDMPFSEKDRWRAEVRTLKALYLFWVFQHYGPIPLQKVNIDISADLDMMNRPREKVDVVVDYIVSLLDEVLAMNYALPDRITSTYNESGRITQCAVYALKAKVLIWAASPLFNGNTDYAGFIDPVDGEPFFNQTRSVEKWERAARACKEAIAYCEQAGHKLYEFDERVVFPLNDESRLLLTLCNNIPSRFNDEEIFSPGNIASTTIQNYCQPRLTPYMVGINLDRTLAQYAPTLNVVELYYSKNGVPINEDNTGLDFSKTLAPTPDNVYYYAQDYTTVNFHLNREPRFYASIGFDGGKWFCTENETIEEAYDLMVKKGDLAGLADQASSATGYFVKKLVSYKNENRQESYVLYSYSVPIIRLADLYLMCSEALNEVKEQPDAEVYEYIQKVRWRAGLDMNSTLVDTWRVYSNNPTKPTTKTGMAEIIRNERHIELAFEGHRYHDLRRWKMAVETMNNRPIRGWTITESLPEGFYREKVIHVKSFTPRDYLWPLQNSAININPKLVQNPNW